MKLQVSFVFPIRAKEAGSVCFAHYGEDTSPATNKLVSRHLVELEAFGRSGDVVEGDVEGRGLS